MYSKSSFLALDDDPAAVNDDACQFRTVQYDDFRGHDNILFD